MGRMRRMGGWGVGGLCKIHITYTGLASERRELIVRVSGGGGGGDEIYFSIFPSRWWLD